MSDKPFIPFWAYPFSWGLKGKARAIAKANYELQGYELDHTLLFIEKEDLPAKEFEVRYRALQLRYKQITQYQHDHYLADLIEDPKKKKIAKAYLDLKGYDLEKEILLITVSDYSSNEHASALLALEHKFGNLTDSEYTRAIIDLIEDPVKKAIANLELSYKEGDIDFFKYDKEIHTLQGKPWVNVLKMDFQPGKPEEGAFELDWNEHFIKELEDSGYTGGTPDQLINLWFMEVCRNVALDTFDGVGTFTENSASSLNRQAADLPQGRRIHE